MITKVNEDRIKNLQNIPQELKELNNWVHVQFERDGKGNIKLKDGNKKRDFCKSLFFIAYE